MANNFLSVKLIHFKIKTVNLDYYKICSGRHNKVDWNDDLKV